MPTRRAHPGPAAAASVRRKVKLCCVQFNFESASDVSLSSSFVDSGGGLVGAIRMATSSRRQRKLQRAETARARVF
jgi:hypothetical protein